MTSSPPTSAAVRIRLPRLVGARLLGGVVLLLAAGGCFVLGQQTGWPGLSLLSSVGHGLALGLLAVIGLSCLICKREARSLNSGAAAPPAGIDPHGLELLRSEANRRWAFLFLLAWALVPVGLAAALLQLPSLPTVPATDLRPYLPLGIALLEAVLVVLALFGMDARWQDYLDNLSSRVQSHLAPPSNGQVPHEEPVPMPLDWPDLDGEDAADSRTQSNPETPAPQDEDATASRKKFKWPTAR